MYTFPETLAFKSTFRFSAIPTPPETTNAPEVEFVDVVLDCMYTFPFDITNKFPETLAFKSTFRFSAIPTPPEITNAPEV